MLKYIELGSDKQLNEIVFAGSHDAGITEGSGHAQTQTLDIYEQAIAGVRFFDVRVAAKGDSMNLRAFHAPGTKGKASSSSGQKLKGAAFGSTWGMTLNDILMGAKNFLMSAEGAGEFIILKFDKCTGWTAIADMCRDVLGRNLYVGSGNVNKKELRALSGKVICAFMPSGYAEFYKRDVVRLDAPPPRNVPGWGITHIKNLYKPPSGYDPNFDGLQYWGAGGTSVMNARGFSAKIKENKKTQKSILRKAAVGVRDKTKRQGIRAGFRKKTTPGCSAANPNAVGMMYWTTTGVFKNIRERDSSMWDRNQLSGLDEIWNAGFGSYLEQVLPGNIGFESGSGGALKMFMPNIVMIDFSSLQKCEHIYYLNTIASVQLALATQQLNDKYG